MVLIDIIGRATQSETKSITRHIQRSRAVVKPSLEVTSYVVDLFACAVVAAETTMGEPIDV